MAVVKTTYDFDQMLSNAREAYGEELLRMAEEGLDFVNAAYEGTAVVINSVIGSTITTVIVYLPLALLEGLSGQYFKQLGYTIVFVLIASLISLFLSYPL